MRLENTDRVLLTSAAFTVVAALVREVFGAHVLDRLAPATLMAYAAAVTLWCSCAESPLKGRSDLGR